VKVDRTKDSIDESMKERMREWMYVKKGQEARFKK
jgi:hypothetical protein